MTQSSQLLGTSLGYKCLSKMGGPAQFATRHQPGLGGCWHACGIRTSGFRAMLMRKLFQQVPQPSACPFFVLAMARSSSVLAGSLLGAASLGGLAFLAPGQSRPQLEVQHEVASAAPGFLASTSSSSSAAQGVTGALAVAGLSVAAVRGASAASRQKGIKPRAAKSVVACRSLAKLKIDEVDLKDKRIFIRVDFNVPQDKKDPNIITNTARIDAALPTIKYALDNGAKSVVLCSHLGRPNGQKDEKFSMKPVAKVVEEKLGRPVKLMNDVIGEEVEAACADPEPGTVILLENSRYYVEEEGKGKDADGNKVKADEGKVKDFRASLAKMADIYCSDAGLHSWVVSSAILPYPHCTRK